MKIQDIFTADELALIDSGDYKPGRAVLDAKLDLVMALEREACAKVCDDLAESFEQVRDFGPCAGAEHCADAIRARGNT